MSRAAGVGARDVERAYAEAKEVLPGLAPLHRDATYAIWYVGTVNIGGTAREARAVLRGMRLAIRFAGLAGAA